MLQHKIIDFWEQLPNIVILKNINLEYIFYFLQNTN